MTVSFAQTGLALLPSPEPERSRAWRVFRLLPAVMRSPLPWTVPVVHLAECLRVLRNAGYEDTLRTRRRRILRIGSEDCTKVMAKVNTVQHYTYPHAHRYTFHRYFILCHFSTRSMTNPLGGACVLCTRTSRTRSYANSGWKCWQNMD